MFTGIIESEGIVKKIGINGSNKTFWIKSDISKKLKPDQSVSHDGVCLTIEEIKKDLHRVTAIAETLKKSTINNWQEGSMINLERSLRLSDRLDGHFVLGHIDATGICLEVSEKVGSREYRFSVPGEFVNLLIEKGSICINGVSLTIFNVSDSAFTVAIIPHTFKKTNFKAIEKNSLVNIELDVLGKYVNRITSLNSA